MIFNKKGNTLLDSLLVLLVLFIFSIFAIIGMYTFDAVKTDIDSTGELTVTEAQETLNSTYVNYQSLMDNGFLIIFIFLWILVIVASFMIDTHPIFFIISVILLIIVLFVAGTLGNFYVEFAESSGIVDVTSMLPIIGFVMERLMAFILAIGISIILALFVKFKTG